MTSPVPVFASNGQAGALPLPTSHLRLARPSRDLAKAERFYVDGLGLKVLFRLIPEQSSHQSGSSDHHENSLLMLGWVGAAWHLELAQDQPHPGKQACIPQPTEEDLLVLYLDGPIDESIVKKLIDAGGKRVAARNPYWDTFGVTIEDPDGYRLVLSQRGWTNE